MAAPGASTEAALPPGLVSRGPGRQRYGVLRQLLQLWAVYTWIGWLLTLTLAGAALLVLPRPAQVALAGVLVAGAVLPLPDSGKDRLPPRLAQFGNLLMVLAAEYFSLQVQMSSEADAAFERLRTEDRPVVISGTSRRHPLQHVLQPPRLQHAGPDDQDRGMGARALMSSILFLPPGMRHVYKSVCAASADKKEMYRLLDKGISCSLIPGGVSEVALLDKGSDNDIYLFLKSRLGFVKIALEKGCPIVPAFCFGILDAYSWWIPPGKLTQTIGRKTGFLPMVYFGAFGVPLSITEDPVPLTVVVGEPIHGPPLPTAPSGCEPGTALSEQQKEALKSEVDAIVRATHAAYVEAMVALFETHAAAGRRRQDAAHRVSRGQRKGGDRHNSVVGGCRVRMPPPADPAELLARRLLNSGELGSHARAGPCSPELCSSSSARPSFGSPAVCLLPPFP
ncbi:unnamed protein product, partial [Prorocentrum cordatum]